MSQFEKPLFSLTVEEFMTLNQKMLSEKFGSMLEEVKKQTGNEKSPKDIIFLTDVCEITGYKKPTVYSKVSRGEIPVLSNNSPLTFSRKAIIDWISMGRPSAADFMVSQKKNKR